MSNGKKYHGLNCELRASCLKTIRLNASPSSVSKLVAREGGEQVAGKLTRDLMVEQVELVPVKN